MQVRFKSASPSIDVIPILRNYIEKDSKDQYLNLLELKNDPNVNMS